MNATALRPRGYIANYRPQARTRKLLADVDAVLEEYREYWPLASRQIFYRLGSYGYEKQERFYGTLCHHVANARRARWIPFDAIRDDGVSVVQVEQFYDADHFRRFMREKAQNYQRDLMAVQPIHVEVWCEAAGMLPQLARVANYFSIAVYSSSGFDSLTAKKALADRICTIGKRAIILHLGDFDPSGESIFRVIEEDVRAFVLADRPWHDIDVEFRRVALTAEQVARYGLPTAPPKVSDSRSKAWKGNTCQLEALAPDQIAHLLDEAVRSVVDLHMMKGTLAVEKVEREELTRALLPAPSSTASRNNREARL